MKRAILIGAGYVARNRREAAGYLPSPQSAPAVKDGSGGRRPIAEKRPWRPWRSFNSSWKRRLLDSVRFRKVRELWDVSSSFSLPPTPSFRGKNNNKKILDKCSLARRLCGGFVFVARKFHSESAPILDACRRKMGICCLLCLRYSWGLVE